MRGMDINELAVLVGRELANSPALLIFDDFQKAKPEIDPLFRLLTDLSDQFDKLRIVIVGREVPGFYTRKDVTVNKAVEEIHLDGLGRDETRALLGEGYGEEALERIFKISRGVPLFLEILSSVDNVDSIGDVQKYVEEEIYADLEPGRRTVLKNLSVHRYPVPPEAVLVEGAVFDDLSALCRKSLVMELPHRRFEAHDLVKEFAYGRTTPEERAGCHVRAARFYMASASKGDPHDELYYSPDLANLEAVHHLLEGGDVEQGAALLLKVGPDLCRRGYNEVQELLGSIDSSDVDKDTWAGILLLRGDAAVAVEDWNLALENYQKAIKAKRTLGADKSTLAEIHGMIGRVQMHVQRWEETIHSHKDALRIYEEFGDERGIAKELINLGIVYRNRRDWKKAEVSYERARRILEKLEDLSGLVVLHNNMALLRMAQGDLGRAERHINRGMARSEEAGDELGKAVILFTSGDLKMARGRMDVARKEFERSADIFRGKGEFDPAIRVLLRLGDGLMENGRTDRAVRSYLKALDIYQFKKGSRVGIFRRRRAVEDHSMLGGIYDRLSSAFRAKGDLEQALAYDSRTIDCYDAEGDGSAVARKLLDMGLTFEDMDRPKEAISHMERALERLSHTEDDKGAAVVRLNLARAYERAGDVKRATRHLEMVVGLAHSVGDNELASIARKEIQRLGKATGRKGARKGKKGNRARKG
jgi:tetratricopeptide (TPR) repeat protein